MTVEIQKRNAAFVEMLCETMDASALDVVNAILDQLRAELGCYTSHGLKERLDALLFRHSDQN